MSMNNKFWIKPYLYLSLFNKPTKYPSSPVLYLFHCRWLNAYSINKKRCKMGNQDLHVINCVNATIFRFSHWHRNFVDKNRLLIILLKTITVRYFVLFVQFAFLHQLLQLCKGRDHWKIEEENHKSCLDTNNRVRKYFFLINWVIVRFTVGKLEIGVY